MATRKRTTKPPDMDRSLFLAQCFRSLNFGVGKIPATAKLREVRFDGETATIVTSRGTFFAGNSPDGADLRVWRED